MARIPLIDESATPEIAALARKIRGARGGQLHVFYQALLHSPDLAAAWFEFNNAVRFKASLDDRVRELVIMRVAALTGCQYVWSVHEAQYAAKAGVTPPEIAALRSPHAFQAGTNSPHAFQAGPNRGRDVPGIFEGREQALLAYVDAMTRDVAVPDQVFEGISRHFSAREIAEVTVLVGAYNMQTRVLRALGIEAWKA